MFGLIEPDRSAARKSYGRCDAPLSFQHFSTGNLLVLERLHGGAQVIAHEIQNSPEQRMVSVHLYKISIAGMYSHFRPRQLEDQPSTACIHGAKPQDVLKERTIGFGVFAVEQKVHTINHAAKCSTGFGRETGRRPTFRRIANLLI